MTKNTHSFILILFSFHLIGSQVMENDEPVLSYDGNAYIVLLEAAKEYNYTIIEQLESFYFTNGFSRQANAFLSHRLKSLERDSEPLSDPFEELPKSPKPGLPFWALRSDAATRELPSGNSSQYCCGHGESCLVFSAEDRLSA
ncbi:uncharacterized protein LOC129591412 [Paramacrobiotus metropolitanus]|uniref:uncharacterized protein LOC129591412 n=1 Tax=Paramacrobiotus metropolitanus TaxID=2943436 RepID=UPI00244605E5|nr:uncharacterized protein LOC129591412 [Paramacrobiotus metropolitanus]